MNRIVWIIIGVVVLVAASGASFYGGMVYGEGRAQAARTAAGRFGGFNGGSNNGLGGQFGQGGQGAQAQRGGVFGQITEIGDGYLVVTDNSGKQTKIQVTDTTLIEKNASVKLSDLATGDSVIVSGSEGSDGTYTARSVQVAPAGRFGGAGARGTPQTPTQ
jgi:Domain of unknown function (DUF5666)